MSSNEPPPPAKPWKWPDCSAVACRRGREVYLWFYTDENDKEAITPQPQPPKATNERL
jgi:hypothetical protein